MGDSSPASYNGKLNDSMGLEITGKIMISVMMILFFTIVLIFFLQFYFKCFSYGSHYERDVVNARLRRQRHQFDFAVGHPTFTAHHGLDPSVLSSIPVLVFSSRDEKMECAVCLLETVQGEKVRILPKCNHGFHVDCIDMWFQSNSTCPICRNLVSNQPELKAEALSAAVFPTNVLVWGNQGEVTSLSSNLEEPSNSSSAAASSSSSRPDEILVIDIPRQIDEDEEAQSPVMKQLKSLKRLLSRGATSVNHYSSRDDPGKMGLEKC